MRRIDFFIIGAALITALAVFLIFNTGNDGTARILITSEGNTLTPVELTEKTYEIELNNAYGKNILRVTPDGAEIIWADCASQTCVHTGKITRPGQIIACLPHHLLITLETPRKAGDIDAVAR